MSHRRREAPRGRPARPLLPGLLALVSLGCKPTERELPGCLTVEPDAGAYFCGSAGPPLRGYYSYDLGRWHIISLNSNGDAFEVGGALVFGVALGAP